MKERKVVICFKQPLFEESIAYFLDCQLGWKVIKVPNCLSPEPKTFIRDLEYDLLIVDASLNLKEMENLKEAVGFNKGKMIFLCNLNQGFELSYALSFKAHGYLTTDISCKDLIDSIQKVLEDQVVVSPLLVPKMVDAAKNLAYFQETPQKRVTPREKEIINLLVSGATNKQIAKELVISENTVKNHVHNLLGKLELKNRAKLVSYAISTGLVSTSCSFAMVLTCLCL